MMRWWRALQLSLLIAAGGAASAIAYTVQVIAVSDQATALSISRDLLRDGYPAYVVRSTGAQGDVFRVRVGAFANRSAALRYAESMPDVAGSRPVPALAEAIPAGIMPLAPRLLWQGGGDGDEVRVLPWPAGVALRVQRVDPLRQATYFVFQDGQERRFEAWAAFPLATLPEPDAPAELDVPIVDLTEPQADAPMPPAAEPVVGGEPDGAGEDAAEAALADEAPAGDAARWQLLDRVADANAAEPEAGLLLLRDRSLWPPSWDDDPDEVREAFQASSLTVLAAALELDVDSIAAATYFPGGGPPPAVIVVDTSDSSARDAGRIVALADAAAGVRVWGPERFLVEGEALRLPSWPATRIRTEPAADTALGGDGWQVRADAGFVRITLPDGATWRAGVGAPVWSDGRFVVAWDGERFLLYDFVPR